MQKKRLLKLADLLEADAKNKKGIKFDFAEWGQVTDPKKPMSCGTTACAMGLAAISGAFEQQGLKFEIAEQVLSYKGRWGALDAAEGLFDLTTDEAEYLFANAHGLPEIEGAKAERAVAKRIREFVKTGEIVAA